MHTHQGVQTRHNKRARNDDFPSAGEDVRSAVFSNEGRDLGGGNGEAINLDDKSADQAHVYVLHNCDELAEYISEHEQEVNNMRGTRFHTIEREARRKTQNSDVTLYAITSSFASAKVTNPVSASVAYYGSEEGELEPRQPLFGEQPDNLTSPAIPTDDGELALERTELIPTVIEVGPHVKTARGQEADFTEESDADESS
ncbi:hypothetical protein PIB30_090620 [Stylosanthes scabra]|uniref:Uncharacterized protein n=1 Tax=Stylosanthes scabra TaxID=79078 RepID=A0ABU6ZSZ0_9FABA|nr:hypothetical protein [Stylosanthes scabra]